MNELELSRRLGIKRGPLREAIRRLQGRNLVHCAPNLGARIVIHSAKDILDAYEVRESLESTAARLSAEWMTDGEIAALREVAYEPPTYGDARDPAGSASSHLRFHLQIIRGSRNDAIARILDEDFFQLLRLWRVRFPWLRRKDEVSLGEHQQVAEAIAARDGELAERLLRDHIRRLRQDIAARMKTHRSN